MASTMTATIHFLLECCAALVEAVGCAGGTDEGAGPALALTSDIELEYEGAMFGFFSVDIADGGRFDDVETTIDVSPVRLDPEECCSPEESPDAEKL